MAVRRIYESERARMAEPQSKVATSSAYEHRAGQPVVAESRHFVNVLRGRSSDAVRLLYRKLPLPVAVKMKVKAALFSVAPFLFRHTLAYRSWKAMHRATIAPASGQAIPFDEMRWETEGRNPPIALTRQTLDFVPKVRTIAFYLPQYHPIPENDEFWGRGFTEWTNVTRAVPRFRGHEQPRLPGELGFYDLRVVDVQRRQVELAKLYGIEAFCFYFYWFSGRRLLELPLQQYLDNPDLDLPFCICWANENWTRTWDGAESQILIGQKHSPEDDLAFIAYVVKYLRDPRYVRVGGKPLLIVYRPKLLPNIVQTTQRWRAWCRDNGIGDIHLAYVQSFDAGDPSVLGFDAAIEFPPNNMHCPLYTGPIENLDPGFSGVVYDWDYFRRRSKAYPVPNYRLYRGVTPSWDNEARRPRRGAVFVGNSPERYREWLENAARDTIARFDEPSERVVFINAWNEWAEGAYLEPDQRNGYAYLAATRSALEAVSRTDARGRAKILLVGHDAHPHGAQFLMLGILREVTRRFGVEAECVLLRNGPLESEYRRLAPIHLLGESAPDSAAARTLAADLRSRGFTLAISNTTASGLFVRTLAEAGIAVVSLVHELPEVLRSYEGRGLMPEATALVTNSAKIVFPNAMVADEFRKVVAFDPDKALIRAQGLYKRTPLRSPDAIEEARRSVRAEFGWPNSVRIVLAVGFGDWRKGVDLFVNVAERVLLLEKDVAFLWAGKLDGNLAAEVTARRDSSDFSERIAFAGFRSDTERLYAAADLLALPSREDPFPSVVLEAFDSGLPVIAFSGAGGFESLFQQSDVGALVPAFDIEAFAGAITELLRDDARRRRQADTAVELARAEFAFPPYVRDLLNTAGAETRAVSVIVPNFNYCHYLEGRLHSVAVQTHAPFEVIVADDASSDGSAGWLAENLERICPGAEMLVNAVNSGSVFRQWYNGCRKATGEFVWIAEADDLADADFLTTLLAAFDDPDVVLSYCQSRQMAPDGTILCGDYLDYVAEISTTRWRRDYVADGADEIRSALAIKNTIPNVSAVVFRREVLLDVLETNLGELDRLRVAGDWLVYLEVLRRGKVAFTARALNSHRRHVSSVTSGTDKLAHLREVMTMQRRVRGNFAPTPEVLRSAETYAEALYQQFGLANPAWPSVADHPELNDLLAGHRAAKSSIIQP